KARKIVWLLTGIVCQLLPESNDCCSVPSELSVQRGTGFSGKDPSSPGVESPCAAWALCEASFALPGTTSEVRFSFCLIAFCPPPACLSPRASLASGFGICNDATVFSTVLSGTGNVVPVTDFSAIAPTNCRDSCRSRSVTAAPTTRTQATAAPHRKTGQESQLGLTRTAETASAKPGWVTPSETISLQLTQRDKCSRTLTCPPFASHRSANALSKFGSGCSPSVAPACIRCLTILDTSAIL